MTARRWVSGLAILFALATGLRLAFVLVLHRPADHVVSDMWVYDFRAHRLMDGTADVWDTFTPVGYPALLAILYRVFGAAGQAAAGALQALMGGGIAVFAALLARDLGARSRVALIAGAATALHLPFVLYSGLLLTEVPSAFLLTAGLWLYLHAWRRPTWAGAIGAGLLLGAGLVIRPNLALAAPPALAATWFALRRDRRVLLRVVLGATLGALPIVVPAYAHNARLAGRPAGLGTNGGLNFFLNFAEVSGARFKEGTFVHQITPVPNLLRWREPFDSPRPFHDDRFFYDLGLDYIRDQPGRLVRALNNLVEGAGAGQQTYWPGWPGHDRLLSAWSIGFCAIGVVPAVVSAAILLWRRRQTDQVWPPLLLAGTVASAFAVLYLFLGDPRVRVPFDALILVLVALGAEELVRWRAAGQTTPASS